MNTFFFYLKYLLRSSAIRKISFHHKISKQFSSKRVIIGFGTVIRGSILGFDIFIGEDSLILNSSVGDNTYFNSRTKVTNAKIGKFCSIGTNVKIGVGSHPTNMVSTHPCFYANNKSFKTFAEKMYFEEEHAKISIGNDVWIGSDVSILNNLKIGNGAIIALGSIVTKDVPDYAIVAGIPAKVIKYRFSEGIIKSLLTIRWWDFEGETIQKVYKDFHNVEFFIKKYGKN